ncbi:hypothetical protein OPV22_008814 [Ensete ventricosum]|uniref:CCHC-type domain-containing protein n=1 Tax=Ensete ventricosum TaxID=4639 RepID=A0AAV8RBY5_ENSVE|nr:hypothetical protein OPV22_008814 [Ensete ventricosum]
MRWRSKGKTAPADEDEETQSVIALGSSDDEEANEDLSLAIVEKARQREAKRKRSEDALGRVPAAEPPASAVRHSSVSPSSGGAELVSDRNPESSVGGLTSLADGERKKKKPKKPKKKQQKEVEEKKVIGALVDEEQPPRKGESVIAEVNGVSDNLVFRKLLRVPRYFDSGGNNWETCFNCGEEGHIAANCTMEKRQKPCFYCGLFGHNSKQCLQGQDCFVCKRKGHLAKDCPDKNKKIIQESAICLRCGEAGHIMSSCRNDYSPDDLKETQCYVCTKYGHLCCVNFKDSCPIEIFCYNCAQPGHNGLGCAKPRGENISLASPTLCYICHEEGHFARGCTKRTKSARKMGESSTSRTFDNKNRRYRGTKSVPRDFGKGQRKKNLLYEERWNMTTGQSKIKGGWIVDDPGRSRVLEILDYGYVCTEPGASGIYM